MFATEEDLAEGCEWDGADGWEGPGWYVVDYNGILAGRFDDFGEAQWWLDKHKRV